MTATREISSAVIPVAGKGTRMAPVTSVLPKALLPLVDQHGQLRTVLEMILADVAEAGIEHAILVVSPGQREMIETYLAAAGELGRTALVERIDWQVQTEAAGFGDAVAQTRPLLGQAGVLVMLGDHIHLPQPFQPSCTRQVIDAWRKDRPAAMIGMQPVEESELHLVGTAGGEPLGDGLYRCRDFVEKPDLETARKRLRTPGLAEGTYLAHAGIFAFGPEIFDALDQEARAAARTGREVQLAGAQEILLGQYPQSYLLRQLAGVALDTGTPDGYEKTQAALRAARI
ncbi:MAG: sugar phosphate nucleotidyltransferase [Phycisphaerae bacterium]